MLWSVIENDFVQEDYQIYMHVFVVDSRKQTQTPYLRHIYYIGPLTAQHFVITTTPAMMTGKEGRLP